MLIHLKAFIRQNKMQLKKKIDLLIEYIEVMISMFWSWLYFTFKRVKESAPVNTVRDPTFR